MANGSAALSVVQHHLATADHDMDHADFSGVLSPQRRGGGVVQVWDRGTFRTMDRRAGEPVTATQALAQIAEQG